jgi:hypothetical protein
MHRFSPRHSLAVIGFPCLVLRLCSFVHGATSTALQEELFQLRILEHEQHALIAREAVQAIETEVSE